MNKTAILALVALGFWLLTKKAAPAVAGTAKLLAGQLSVSGMGQDAILTKVAGASWSVAWGVNNAGNAQGYAFLRVSNPAALGGGTYNGTHLTIPAGASATLTVNPLVAGGAQPGVYNVPVEMLETDGSVPAVAKRSLGLKTVQITVPAPVLEPALTAGSFLATQRERSLLSWIAGR